MMALFSKGLPSGKACFRFGQRYPGTSGHLLLRAEGLSRCQPFTHAFHYRHTIYVMEPGARTLDQIPEHWIHWGEFWRGASFRWRRWESSDPKGTHDHCLFCSAYICASAGEYSKLTFYRHAYFAQHTDGTYTWVCRACFKRAQSELGFKREANRA